MKTVILAGGKGTRAYPYTAFLPKPMMPVGGKPMLARIMELFASQGHRIVLSVGYLKDIIVDYFDGKQTDWQVSMVDTGTESDTGERVRGCREHLTEPFFVTYGDGLSDVPLDQLLTFHRQHGKLVAITSVPLVSQYGTLETDSQGRVIEFREKPRLDGHWINAGFFVMQPAVFDHWRGQNLEREILPSLAADDQLYCYRHDGFFSRWTPKRTSRSWKLFARTSSTPSRNDANS